MKAYYLVHSVGPYEKTVETTLPDGSKGEALVRATVLELVSESAEHGTVKLVSWGASPFQAGDRILATFEKVV